MNDGSIFDVMSEFEKLYLAVRNKEQRIYTDEEVLKLPYVNSSHVHYKEWLVRQASFKRLFKHLVQKERPLKILDVGCGNGWMTNKLSEINSSTVTGVDVNSFEIEQAKRVFADNKSVNFICGSILEEDLFKNETFDIIILAASVQYFNDAGKLLNYLLELLNKGGEIHILDSNFYTNRNIQKARLASLNYYRKLGLEEMAKNYFHHSWKSLASFNYAIKNKFLNLISRGFLWIIITG